MCAFVQASEWSPVYRREMSSAVWPQPLVVVTDVGASSAFYCSLLDGESGHGGEDYEQIICHGELVLQLHRIDVEDHHGLLADAADTLGKGILLWFEVDDFEAAAARAHALDPPIIRDVETNPNAGQQEVWLCDPDGYLVVLAGPSPYRPRVDRD